MHCACIVHPASTFGMILAYFLSLPPFPSFSSSHLVSLLYYPSPPSSSKDKDSFYVFSGDGKVQEKKSATKVTCVGASSTAALTLVDSSRCSMNMDKRCYTDADCSALGDGGCSALGAHSDVLWLQAESLGTGPNAAGLCRFSIAEILTMVPATPVAKEEITVTNIPDAKNEGLVFIPAPRQDPGAARYGGYFMWGEQDNRVWRRFTLGKDDSTLTWLDTIVGQGRGAALFAGGGPGGCSLGIDADISDG